VAEGWMLLCFAYLLPRGTVTRAMAFDMARAMVAMACTLLPLWALQPLSIWLLGPLGIVLFAAVAWTVGLVRQADVAKLRQLLAKKTSAPGQPPA
jgi:hypothetical protein